MNNSDTQPEDDFIKMLDKHFDSPAVQFTDEERNRLIKKIAEKYEQEEDNDDFAVLMDKATEFPELALSSSQRDVILSAFTQAQSLVIVPEVFRKKQEKKRYVIWALAASIVLLFSLLFILRHEPKSNESFAKQLELLEGNKIEETRDPKPPAFPPPYKKALDLSANKIWQLPPSFAWNDIPPLPRSNDFSLKVEDKKIGLDGRSVLDKNFSPAPKNSDQTPPVSSKIVSVNPAALESKSPRQQVNPYNQKSSIPHQLQNNDVSSLVERKNQNELFEPKNQAETSRDYDSSGNQLFINSLAIETLTRLPNYYKEHIGTLLLLMPHVADFSSNYGIFNKSNHQLISDDLMMHYSLGAGFHKLQKVQDDYDSLSVTSEQKMFEVSFSKCFANDFDAAIGLYLGDASGRVDNYFYIPSVKTTTDADYDMDLLKCFAALNWHSNPWYLSANYSYTSYNSDVYSHYVVPGSQGPSDQIIDMPFEGSIQHLSLNAAYKTRSRYLNHAFLRH